MSKSISWTLINSQNYADIVLLCFVTSGAVHNKGSQSTRADGVTEMRAPEPFSASKLRKGFQNHCLGPGHLSL